MTTLETHCRSDRQKRQRRRFGNHLFEVTEDNVVGILAAAVVHQEKANSAVDVEVPAVGDDKPPPLPALDEGKDQAKDSSAKPRK